MVTRGTSTLRIGFDDPFRPLAWSGVRGPEGPLIEMAARIVQDAGFKPSFVPLTLQHSLAALAAGEVDALAYKAVVPERRAEALFTMPFMITGAALFLRAGSTDRSPRVLATPAQGPLVNLLAKRFPDARRILTEDYPKALEAVIARQADAAALNVHVGWHWAEALYAGQFAPPEELIENLPLAMAVGKHQGAELRDRLDGCIARLKSGGEFRAILERSGVPVLD